jgi:hypothetical protein
MFLVLKVESLKPNNDNNSGQFIIIFNTLYTYINTISLYLRRVAKCLRTIWLVISEEDIFKKPILYPKTYAYKFFFSSRN